MSLAESPTQCESHDVSIDSNDASEDSSPLSNHDERGNAEVEHEEASATKDPPNDAVSDSEAHATAGEIETEDELGESIEFGTAAVSDPDSPALPLNRRLWNFIRQRDVSLSEIPAKKMPDIEETKPDDIKAATKAAMSGEEKPVFKRMVGCLAGCLLQRKENPADRENGEEYTPLFDSPDHNDAASTSLMNESPTINVAPSALNTIADHAKTI